MHNSVAEQFVRGLQLTLQATPMGDYCDPRVRVGPILNRGLLSALGERLLELSDDTVFGGEIDIPTGFVSPTIVERPIGRHDHLDEFFAPVFYVLRYDGNVELAAFFDRDEYTSRAMYVSLFGETAPPSLYRTSTVLAGQTLLDVERGNDPYGGYGPLANYVARGDEVLDVGPILISATVARHSTQKR